LSHHLLLLLYHLHFVSDEPSEWLYEIDEPERSKRARNEDGKKRKMMIDITDDTTGQVHELARQYSSIYVNETGHSPDLHENV
jgi:hypothetical protein